MMFLIVNGVNVRYSGHDRPTNSFKMCRYQEPPTIFLEIRRPNFLILGAEVSAVLYQGFSKCRSLISFDTKILQIFFERCQISIAMNLPIIWLKSLFFSFCFGRDVISAPLMWV